MVSYLDEFIRESGQSAVGRIADLFDFFSNELVKIESKRIRLPHFTKVETRAFADTKPYIACSFRGGFWIVAPCEQYVGETDVINFMRNAKALGYKISNKIIMPLNGMDENAKLLAKELRISIWDTSVVNMLLNFYNKAEIITI